MQLIIVDENVRHSFTIPRTFPRSEIPNNPVLAKGFFVLGPQKKRRFRMPRSNVSFGTFYYHYLPNTDTETNSRKWWETCRCGLVITKWIMGSKSA